MLGPDQSERLARLLPRLTRTPALAGAIGQLGQFVRLPGGQTICSEGTECQHLALVVDGSARVFKIGETGREITLYRVNPGECCILTASCILSRRAFPAFAVSESPVEAVLLPARQVVEWMTAHEPWRDYVWDMLAGRLADVITLVEEIAFRRVDERLADYLLESAGEDPVLLTTHQKIATDLGTSREVVSRILKDFEARGVLELGRGTLRLLDPSALQPR
jgi:CRP/FNR family transcriptional regulator